MSTLTTEMRSRLARYAAGQCSLEQFEDWFAPVLRNVYQSNDPEAEQLAVAIEWAFCDMERGMSSPELLKKNLEVLSLPENTTKVGNPLVLGGATYDPDLTAGTSSTFQVGAAVGAAVSFGPLRILREAEYA